MTDTVNKTYETDKIAAALCELQSVLEGAKKDSTNPYFKSKYADLEAVWEAARPHLKACGLSVAQPLGYLVVGENVITTLKTVLMHTSGQFIIGEMPLFLKTNDPQGQGSAITYARRYSFAAMLGIHQTDDDGESATAPVRNLSTQSFIKGLGAAERAAFFSTAASKGYDREAAMALALNVCKDDGLASANFATNFTEKMREKTLKVIEDSAGGK